MPSRPPSIPAWPSLDLRAGVRRAQDPPFPLDRPPLGTFYAARYALHRVFRSLALPPGRKVLVPAYHHGNEVRAIRAAGAEVGFYPVQTDLTLRLEELERSCREGVSALLLIHYLGWPQPVGAVRDLCRRRGIVLVEDCALALLSVTEGGEPLGSLGDYGVFCLYKTLPVPDGALLVSHPGRPGEPIAGGGRHPDLLSLAARTSELVLRGVSRHSGRLGDALLALKGRVGSSLTAAGVARLPVGDDGFRAEAADTRASWLTRVLLPGFDCPAIVRRRRENFLVLRDRLAGRATPLLNGLPRGTCPLFFPLLVADKRAAADALRARGIETVEFWNHGDPAASEAAFPQAHWLRRHVLELPLHQDVTPEQAAYIAEQVLALRLRLESERVA